MTYMDKAFNVPARSQNNADGTEQRTREPLLVVIEDGALLSDSISQHWRMPECRGCANAKSR